MLREDVALSAAQIERYLAATWPDLPDAAETVQEDEMLAFCLGSVDVVMSKMPAPIPWSDLEGPCAASILWRNASDEVRQHTLHWIVTVSGEVDPLDGSKLLTQATAAVLATCPSTLGVYWGNGTLVIPKPIFIDFAVEAMAAGLPLPIWVDFRVGNDSETTAFGFTTGMAALGHREIETKRWPQSPGELRERLMAICEYILEMGVVFQDGDTLGLDATERIRVVYSRSAFGNEGKVMRLEYQRPGSK
jgi:hypothetical protein